MLQMGYVVDGEYRFGHRSTRESNRSDIHGPCTGHGDQNYDVLIHSPIGSRAHEHFLRGLHCVRFEDEG